MPDGVVLGVAGKCCAGKDTVSNFFIERGFRDVNVDRIGHLALEFQRDEVVSHFGSVILDEGGSIDRGRLGAIVFRSIERRRELESILHPWMAEQVRLAVEEYRASGKKRSEEPGLVINAALLFPMGLHRFCDHVIWTTAPALARFRRARRRDRLTFPQVVNRFFSQRTLQPQDFSSHADMITVKNSGSRSELHAQLQEILTGILTAGD